MSLLTTLKKVLGIQSHGQEYATGPIKGNYSEKSPEDGIQVSEQVANSAIFIRGNKEEGYYLILGNYRITEKIEWLWQAREIAEQTDWKTIMAMTAVMIEVAFKLNKETTIATEPTENAVPDAG